MYLVLSEGFVENEQRVTVLLFVCLYAGGVVILSCNHSRNAFKFTSCVKHIALLRIDNLKFFFLSTGRRIARFFSFMRDASLALVAIYLSSGEIEA